jgi:hypothetical protein
MIFMSSRTVGRQAAFASIVASTYFLVAAFASHIVSKQYDPVSDYISDYAVGPWGWIYGSAFWASSIGCFALALSLTLLVPAKSLSWVGVVFLVIVGCTYTVDFFFPTDILPPGAPPQTIVGTIHLVAALVGWVLFTISAVLLSAHLKNDAYWKRWYGLLMSLAWLSALLFIVLVGVVASKVPFGGIAEKAFILDRNVWTLVVSVLAFNSQGRSASIIRSQTRYDVRATCAKRAAFNVS